MASLTFENTSEPQILPLSALELRAFCIIWSCCQTRLGKVLFLQYIILRPLISLTTEKPSHLKSDKDFYATSKLVRLAVHPQPDPYFRQAPRAFTPKALVFLERKQEHLGYKTTPVHFALIPDLDNYRTNTHKINNSISTV